MRTVSTPWNGPLITSSLLLAPTVLSSSLSSMPDPFPLLLLDLPDLVASCSSRLLITLGFWVSLRLLVRITVDPVQSDRSICTKITSKTNVVTFSGAASAEVVPIMKVGIKKTATMVKDKVKEICRNKSVHDPCNLIFLVFLLFHFSLEYNER